MMMISLIIDFLSVSLLSTDDIHWYPHVLRNERFEGTFNFKEVTRLVDFSLMEVDSLTMT
jgi:hypothetical protein